jgi:hypothetical protein
MGRRQLSRLWLVKAYATPYFARLLFPGGCCQFVDIMSPMLTALPGCLGTFGLVASSQEALRHASDRPVLLQKRQVRLLVTTWRS